MCEFAISQVDVLQHLMGTPDTRGSGVDYPGKVLSGELEEGIECLQVLHEELEFKCLSHMSHQRLVSVSPKKKKKKEKAVASFSRTTTEPIKEKTLSFPFLPPYSIYQKGLIQG